MAARRKSGDPTIREVAAKAGVSLATVSRVLNDHPYVSKPIKRRVERAIKELTYTPNEVARGLRSSSPRIIGVLLRDVANTAFATLWKAASDVCAENGYQVMVVSSERDPVKEAKAVQLMTQNRVAGIVAFVADESESILSDLSEEVPLVLVESELPRLAVDRVLCENRRGAVDAINYLLSLGHRKIEILAGSSKRVPGRERVNGYLAAHAEHNLKVDPACIHEVAHLDEKTRKLLKERLLGSDPSTAIFASSSNLTLETLRFIQQLGLRIPEDISFIGFDNSAVSDLFNPKITTVERDIYQLGVSALGILLKRIEGDRLAPQEVVQIPEFLKIRNSCRLLSTKEQVS